MVRELLHVDRVFRMSLALLDTAKSVARSAGVPGRTEYASLSDLNAHHFNRGKFSEVLTLYNQPLQRVDNKLSLYCDVPYVRKRNNENAIK